MRGYYQFSLRLFVGITSLASLLIVWTNNLYGRLDSYDKYTAPTMYTWRLAAEASANIVVWGTVVLWTCAWVASGPRAES